VNDVVDDSNDLTEEIKISVPGFSNPSTKRLHLRSSVGLNNMVLLDEKLLPMKKETIEEWLETFYQFRLPFYGKRRDLLIQQQVDKIIQAEEKKAFIHAVIKKELIISNQTKQAIEESCKKLKLNPKYMQLSMSSQTQDEIIDLNTLIEKLQKEKARLEACTSNDLWRNDIYSFLTVYRKTIKNIKK
jgi:DNA topoisomerase-2